MRMTSNTSFQRKKPSGRIPDIRGTKPSLANFQVLTSSGIPALDGLLGGGLPLGTVLLIEESRETTLYSKLFMKFFNSEGILHQHTCQFASTNPKENKSFFEHLPDIEVNNAPRHSSSSDKDDHLQIAWRYKKHGSVDSGMEKTIPKHVFNLKKNINSDHLSKTQFDCWTPNPDNALKEADEYKNLFKKIQELASKPDHDVQPDSSITKNVLRISVEDIGNLTWAKDNNGRRSKLLSFLVALRSAMRNSLSVSMISLAKEDIESDTHLTLIREMVDFVIELKPFGEDDNIPGVTSRYHGFLDVRKAMSLNSLHTLKNCQVIGKYLFKSQRTKFVIDMMHLPPAIEETSENTKERDKNKNISNIDF